MTLFQGFSQRYQQELTEEIEQLDGALVTGNVSEFHEYKRLVGRRAGLQQALDRFTELTTLLKDADEKRYR